VGKDAVIFAGLIVDQTVWLIKICLVQHPRFVRNVRGLLTA
jgi:hypothetical protein